MNVALTFGIVLVVLFWLAFVTKRRFGVLGLALTAGAMMSDLWTAKLTPVIADAGVVVQQPPLYTVVAVLLVLLPALVLLFSGPSYRELPLRVVGAFLFAAFALALLIQPLGTALVLQGDSKAVYDFFVTNRVYIVTAGVIVAVLDVLFIHTGRHHYRSGKH